MRRSVVTAAAAVAVMVTATAGCDGGGNGSPTGSRSHGGPGGAAAPGPTRSADPCPASYASPDPQRPRVGLAFDVSDDLGTVRGTEDVAFRPDLPVSELVFRLTPNTPTATRQGTSLRVTRAESPGAGTPTYQRAGADPDTQGGLLVLPLGRTVPAGGRIRAHLEFTLTLGHGGFERYGHDRSVAWWGSGHPLLAWERGVGWHREPMIDFLGESATSEAAETDVTVTAPKGATVMSSGQQGIPRSVGGGRTAWHASAPTARDVSVVVGDVHPQRQQVGNVSVLVGSVGPGGPSKGLVNEVRSAVSDVAARLGPFPFHDLSVTLLPYDGGGIEYPGSILLLGHDRVTTVHEVAHEWFYGMVGDSQARDPWLDEAFATYVEELVDGPAPSQSKLARLLARPDPVGGSTQDFAGRSGAYYSTVYDKGAAALLEARQKAGPAKFDAALTCYVHANAWRIARPADLARALAGLPAALDVLHKAGALR